MESQDYRLKWTGLLLMLIARSVLAIICQLIVALALFRGRVDAWNEAGEYWRVYGTVIDIACILLLMVLARRERKTLFDLGTYSKTHWKRDVLIGLALGIPLLIAFAAPTIIIEMLVYKGQAPVPGLKLSGLSFIYSLVIWSIIWSFAEDNVYFGYSLPRLEALTGKKWGAILLVSVFASLQHIFLPLRFEWQWVVSHFVGYLIGTMIYCLLYLRWRRLLPLHVAHWVINVVGVLMILMGPGR